MRCVSTTTEPMSWIVGLRHLSIRTQIIQRNSNNKKAIRRRFRCSSLRASRKAEEPTIPLKDVYLKKRMQPPTRRMIINITHKISYSPPKKYILRRITKSRPTYRQSRYFSSQTIPISCMISRTVKFGVVTYSRRIINRLL